MGYDVHITRAAQWFDSEETPILFDEWKKLIESDSELEMEKIAEVYAPDGTRLAYENQGLAVWTAFSGDLLYGNQAWFDYRNGRIVVKNPNEEIVQKMKSIAAKLNARVVGDEGESY